jgi:hypothetical protein
MRVTARQQQIQEQLESIQDYYIKGLVEWESAKHPKGKASVSERLEHAAKALHISQNVLGSLEVLGDDAKEWAYWGLLYKDATALSKLSLAFINDPNAT